MFSLRGDSHPCGVTSPQTLADTGLPVGGRLPYPAWSRASRSAAICRQSTLRLTVPSKNIS